MLKQLFIRIFGKPTAEYPVILVCFFMACVIWLFNALNKEYTTQIKYPVHFNYDEERLTSVVDLPKRLQVNVTGQGWNLLKRSFFYKVKPIEIRTSGFVGKRFITSTDLLPPFSQQMPELKVNYVISDSILVNLNRIVSRKVKIVADTTQFKAAEGYKIQYPIQITPNEIEVFGASTKIKDLPKQLLVKLPVATISTDFDEAVPLDYKDYENLTFKNKSVVIHIALIKLKEITLELPITPENIKAGYSLSDSVVTLKIVLADSLANRILTDSIKVVANLKLADPKTKAIPLQIVNLPKGIESYRIEPSTTLLDKK